MKSNTKEIIITDEDKRRVSHIDISVLGEDFYLALLNQFLEYMKNKENEQQVNEDKV